MYNVLLSAGFALLGLSAPLEYLSFALAGLVITPAKISFAVLILIASGQMAASRRPQPGGVRSIWLFIFLISLGVGAIYSYFQGIPPSKLKNVFLTWPSVMLLYYIVSTAMTTRKQLEVLMISYIVAMGIVIISGFVGIGFVTSSAEGDRLGGWGGNPNEVAFHLTFALAMAASFLVGSRSAIRTTSWLGASGFMLLGMLATLSRSGMLALGAMGGWWLLKFRRFEYLRYAIPVVLLVPILLVASPQSVTDRLKTLAPTAAQDDASIAGRLDHYAYGFRAFLSNPIIGVGPSRFVPWAQERGANFHVQIHSVPIGLLAERGLMGFVPFLALVVLSWRGLTRVWLIGSSEEFKKDTELAMLGWRAIFLQVGMAGAIIVANFQPLANDKVLWLFFGLCHAIERMAISQVVALRSEGERVSSAELSPFADTRPGFVHNVA